MGLEMGLPQIRSTTGRAHEWPLRSTTIQANVSDRASKFKTKKKNTPPLYVTFRVLQAYKACYTIFRSQKKYNDTCSSCFSPASRLPKRTPIFFPGLLGAFAGVRHRTLVHARRHRYTRDSTLMQKVAGVNFRVLPCFFVYRGQWWS